MPTRAEPVRRPARGPQEWQAHNGGQTMAMIFHTADEIISFDNIKKRWNVDYAELANIVILQELHVFHCYEIRKVDNITQYIGKDYLFSKDDISLYYGDFDAGMSISSKDEVYYFLLTAEVHKYETENPYLLGRLLDGQEWRDAYGQTAQADSPLSASFPQAPTPLPSPIGGQSEAQDNARVAKLEEENQGLRDEIRGLQDEIERLKQELARKSGAQVQGVDKVAQALALPPYGMIKQLDEAYRKGMTPTEAAKWLKDKQGKNLSWSQLGALLYAGDQMPKYGTQTGQRFYKGDTTEKLPW